MNEILPLVCLFLGLIACPIAYAWTLRRMRARGIPDDPPRALYYVFGTIGGWLLTLGLSPSLYGAVCGLLMVTIAPVVLFVSSLRLASLPARSGYHSFAMCFGFVYPFLTGGAFLWTLQRS